MVQRGRTGDFLISVFRYLNRRNSKIPVGRGTFFITHKKVRPCEQPHLQGRESKGAPLLLGRYVAHVAALGLALLFLQGHALLVHHPLEEAGLLLFGGGEHGHGQAADEGRLADGNQVLRGPVQGQGGSEVITEEEEHQGHQVHDDALGAFACGVIRIWTIMVTAMMRGRMLIGMPNRWPTVSGRDRSVIHRQKGCPLSSAEYWSTR